MADSRVKVKLQIDDETEAKWIRVEVFSARKPDRLSYYDLPITAEDKHVEAAGAILAERVNKIIGDNIDPSDCARKAVEAFNEAKRRFEEEWDRMRAAGSSNVTVATTR